MKLTLGRIAEFIGAHGSFPREAQAAGYSIDSRTIASGELFFAVRGERLDGHDFVLEALKKGAVAAVVRHQQVSRYHQAGKLLAVDDTLAALQSLSTAVRKLWGKTLIAVTGSAGKTTTKDAIAHLLGARYAVFKSEGNLNNHFGLPLQLLRLEAAHGIAVAEMGMSHAGEITALARIGQPDVGVVTNVAPVHLEFFDSLAGIARAKYELIAALPAGGVAVLNADDEFVSQFGRDFAGRAVTFGIQQPAEVQARVLASDGAGSDLEIMAAGRTLRVRLPLLGTHNTYNALAAVAVATAHGVPLEDCAARLATLAPGNRRGERETIAGVAVINDCYNSNPKALAAMVEALAAVPARRRIVVAGEMLELGPAGEEMHRGSGRDMAARKIDALIGVRGLARHMVEAAKAAGISADFVETPETAGEWLAENAHAGDCVLLKASRGVGLERALEVWRARAEAAAGVRR